MPNTPLSQCHQCRREIDYKKTPNPWVFQRWAWGLTGEETPDGEDDVDRVRMPVVSFCNINCVAAYYKLIPLDSIAPRN